MAAPPRVQVWGPGGSGRAGIASSSSGPGGGSAAYGEEPALGGVTAGVTSLSVVIPAPGSGTAATVTGGSVAVAANAGGNASGTTPGAAGAAGTNTIALAGAAGGLGFSGTSKGGGGGAGSPGASGPGGAGNNAGGGSTGAAGGTAGAGGGAAGGSGGGLSSPGSDGGSPGAGSGGGGDVGSQAAGTAGTAQVIITWTEVIYSPSGYATAAGVMSGTHTAVSAFRGYLSAVMATPNATVVNQWAGTFAQPATTANTPPALQSLVVALDPAASVGPGSGTPTAGNWLFCISGWNQAGIAAATVGDADDVHSFWRPGDVTRSQWAVSPSSASTRTSVWYTPNLCRAAQDVYAAPSGAMAGQACLVIEVAGLGSWDAVTGIEVAYAGAATSLPLSLAAPSVPAFILAAVTGDSSTASQALAPGSPWRTLSTVTATDGAGTTCDAVLTAAYLPSTSGSVSISATAGSATDLSGVIIGVQVSAPSPVPAFANPAWAGRMILEAAFGSGFQTPPDQRTWTSLSDSAWTSVNQGWKRFWQWQDQSGVPYALGQLQSGSGSVMLDNWDGAMCPLNGAIPWSFATSGTPADGTHFTVTTAQAASISAGQAFTDTANPGTLFRVTGAGAPSGGLVNVSFTPVAAAVMASPDTVTQVSPLTGVPVRLRMALGTLTDGTIVNRWYTWERNALAWPEKRNKALRGYVPLTLTDIFSVAGGTCPTPYRGEVEQDSPYAWFPGDDATLTGGTLPSTMRNAAIGNTNPLSIIISPNGTGPDTGYGTDGTSAGVFGYTTGVPVGLATYDVGQASGWMPGDPQSGPQSSQSGNPVTASPGSAAWQQIGASGNTGAKGFMLTCNDAGFPPVANGITAEGWFNLPFFGSQKAFSQAGIHVFAQEPYCPLTLMTLTTNSAPVALLQLDTSGHLSLVTYNGTTPTSHPVYSSSDLRTGGWFHVAAALTQGAYRVWVNAGLTADVSGSATISASAWTYLVVNGDMGNSAGGGTTASIQHGANLSWAHVAVYPSRLPAWRIRAHYWAAVTAFGQVPTPAGVAIQLVDTVGGASTEWPDGQLGSGSFGLSTTAFTFSALAVAQVGPYTSGPSPWAPGGAAGSGSTLFGYVVGVSWTGLAPRYAVYTAASVGAETQASVAGGLSEVYTSGYGSGAAGAGIGHLSSGSGAAPPVVASSVGDTVAQRIERVFGYGGLTCPTRAVDSSASLLVKAAGDVGGQQAGASAQNMVDSDNGLMSVDNNNTLCYKSRPHLAADTVTWYIGQDVLAGMIPFESIDWSSDPQRVWDAITLSPYSPDGTSLALVTPVNAAGVNAAQAQYGVRAKNVTSYLQDQSEVQNAANWWFLAYGALSRRAQAVAIDAATHPAAWQMVCGMNPGDLASIFDQPFGQPATTGTYRVSNISRSVAFGANGTKPEGRMVLVLDPLPPSYWS